LDGAQRAEWRDLRGLEVKRGPRVPDVLNRDRQAMIGDDALGNEHQALVPQQGAVGVQGEGLDRHRATFAARPIGASIVGSRLTSEGTVRRWARERSRAELPSHQRRIEAEPGELAKNEADVFLGEILRPVARYRDLDPVPTVLPVPGLLTWLENETVGHEPP